MKLLFVNTNIGYGGASKQMVWVANQCAEYGHNVTFLTYRDNTEKQSLDDDVCHIHIPLEPLSGRGKGVWKTIWKLHRYIKKNEFEIAVGFLLPSQLRLALACIGTGTKILFSQRGDPYQMPPTFRGKIVHWICEKFFCSADAFAFQTPMAAKYYPKSIQQRSMVIPNSIRPLIRTKKRSEGIDKEIVCVARLDIRQKRQDLLIEAFNIISSSYPDYKLKLYGDGLLKDEKYLREMASENENIIFMGPTKDVASAIQNAAITVLSSDSEGIPNALLESMSIGVPSVACDCSPGGAAMLIRNTENGLLVPRGDVRALANAMEYMLKHPKEAEVMGERGKEVVGLYSESVIAKKWIELIEKTINESRDYYHS